MTELSKPIQSSGGSCCGGGAAKAGPKAGDTAKAAPAPVANTRPAASSGCCGG